MERHLDKWVVVTGANDGALGEATTAAFLSRGFNVIATAIDQEKLTFTKPTEGSTDGFLVRLGLDASASKSVEGAIQHVEELTDGKLNYLVNIAGCGYYMPVMDARIKDARHQFDVNIWGSVAVSQAFFPMLRAAKGTIINHVTSAGVSGLNDPFMGIYASSQAALKSISDAMRQELAPFGINVITFITGPAHAQPPRRTTEDLRFGLPTDSAYRYIEDDAVEAMLARISTEAGHDWGQVADELVVALLRPQRPLLPPPFIVHGYRLTLLWWLGSFLPAWLTDWVAFQRGGLSRLQGPPHLDEGGKLAAKIL